MLHLAVTAPVNHSIQLPHLTIMIHYISGYSISLSPLSINSWDSSTADDYGVLHLLQEYITNHPIS